MKGVGQLVPPASRCPIMFVVDGSRDAFGTNASVLDRVSNDIDKV
jgi:hypothetical protein